MDMMSKLPVLKKNLSLWEKLTMDGTLEERPVKEKMKEDSERLEEDLEFRGRAKCSVG